jgi:hypothetical protein
VWGFASTKKQGVSGMEAGTCARRYAIGVTTAMLISTLSLSASGADKRTQNFLVFAPTQQLADEVAASAERFRRELAIYWLGGPLKPWPAPCPIRVVAGPNLAAQGVTTYNPRPVSDFQMEVVGTPERILDSVLPHEVTHTVLATYFGRPLPRWADEGICTTVEHASERNKHEAKLREFLSTRRGIAMNQMFLMKEYPQDVLPLYAQGYSVCRFLIAQKGPRTFIDFLGDYMQRPSWTANIKKHYDYDSLRELQDYWLAWVESGSREVTNFAKVQTASTTGSLAANTGPTNGSVSKTRDPRDLALRDASGNPVNPIRQATAIEPAQGTALASTVADGWYQRRRAGVQDRSNARPMSSVSQSVTPIAPPSVRDSGRYRSAQPQPEQRISRPQPILPGGTFR